MVALDTINQSKLTLIYPNDPRSLQPKLVRHSSLSFSSGKFLNQNGSFCDNWYLKNEIIQTLYVKSVKSGWK